MGLSSVLCGLKLGCVMYCWCRMLRWCGSGCCCCCFLLMWWVIGRVCIFVWRCGLCVVCGWW